MAAHTISVYRQSMLYCDIREDVDRRDMLAWLDYVGLAPPLREMWENPHPFVDEGNLLQVVECIVTTHPTLAVEFAEQFGRNVYTSVAPYQPDLAGVIQTGLFEKR